MGIKNVAVIGAGTMGAGIAQVCAQAGWQTNLYDAFPEGLERGMNTIDAFWDKGIARGKTTAEQKAEWAANLHAISDLRLAVKDVDLVIEAVPEIMEIKAILKSLIYSSLNISSSNSNLASLNEKLSVSLKKV